jgi:hypothetical protein
MKKYKSIKIDFINERIANWGDSSEKPDLETIFPWFNVGITPENHRDKYGNYQWGVEVTVKEVDGEQGSQTVTECKSVLKPMQPTEEQVRLHKKKRYVEEIRKHYTINDEIALMKDAIKAQEKGEKVPAEFSEMETTRKQIMVTVNEEIQNDLKGP